VCPSLAVISERFEAFYKGSSGLASERSLITAIRSRGSMLRQQYEENSLVFRVGMRIRKLRMEQKVSLRDFGKRAGVHPFHVMAIELGQFAANTRTLRSIANALGVAPLDLLNHDAENDDIGHIVELMRKDPDFVQKIKLRVEPLVKN
jgi:transcriptional regulator with XRE-family HTH domain